MSPILDALQVPALLRGLQKPSPSSDPRPPRTRHIHRPPLYLASAAPQGAPPRLTAASGPSAATPAAKNLGMAGRLRQHRRHSPSAGSPRTPWLRSRYPDRESNVALGSAQACEAEHYGSGSS